MKKIKKIKHWIFYFQLSLVMITFNLSCSQGNEQELKWQYFLQQVQKNKDKRSHAQLTCQQQEKLYQIILNMEEDYIKKKLLEVINNKNKYNIELFLYFGKIIFLNYNLLKNCQTIYERYGYYFHRMRLNYNDNKFKEKSTKYYNAEFKDYDVNLFGNVNELYKFLIAWDDYFFDKEFSHSKSYFFYETQEIMTKKENINYMKLNCHFLKNDILENGLYSLKTIDKTYKWLGEDLQKDLDHLLELKLEDRKIFNEVLKMYDARLPIFYTTIDEWIKKKHLNYKDLKTQYGEFLDKYVLSHFDLEEKSYLLPTIGASIFGGLGDVALKIENKELNNLKWITSVASIGCLVFFIFKLVKNIKHNKDLERKQSIGFLLQGKKFEKIEHSLLIELLKEKDTKDRGFNKLKEFFKGVRSDQNKILYQEKHKSFFRKYFNYHQLMLDSRVFSFFMKEVYDALEKV